MPADALSSAEMKYTTTEKERLAIVWAIQKLRHFLLGALFILETDYKPLLWIELLYLRQVCSSGHWNCGSLTTPSWDDNTQADSLSPLPVSLVALEPYLQRADPVLSGAHEPPKAAKEHATRQSKLRYAFSTVFRFFLIRFQ